MDKAANPSVDGPTTASGPRPTAAEELFRFGAAMYLGWAALIWLSQFANLLYIDSRSAKILLLGTCATNILFFIVTRKDADNPPPADMLSLVQCIVGIAWATVFTFLCADAGFISIGIYVSIILFAMFRVTQPVLNQIIVFGVIAYSLVNFSKILITGNQNHASDYLFQMLIFAGIMACLTSASRFVYRQQQQFEAKFRELQQNLQDEQSESFSRLFSRRYILDLLTREKARTDRKNMPFSVCIFRTDTTSAGSESSPLAALQNLETLIRSTLRDMDAVNSIEFHSGFDVGNDQKFLAMLPETNLSGARASAERVLANVTARLDATGSTFRLSCGLAQYERGESIRHLLERAEQALERAAESPVSAICDRSTAADGSLPNRARVLHLNTRR